jgi:hypothetical protein
MFSIPGRFPRTSPQSRGQGKAFAPAKIILCMHSKNVSKKKESSFEAPFPLINLNY